VSWVNLPTVKLCKLANQFPTTQISVKLAGRVVCHFDVPIQPVSNSELDTTDFLGDNDVQLYQSYIGILHSVVDLGRIDIAHAAGAMARFSASPHEGHMCIQQEA
jgi:hypothetical protein